MPEERSKRRGAAHAAQTASAQQVAVAVFPSLEHQILVGQKRWAQRADVNVVSAKWDIDEPIRELECPPLLMETWCKPLGIDLPFELNGAVVGDHGRRSRRPDASPITSDSLPGFNGETRMALPVDRQGGSWTNS